MCVGNRVSQRFIEGLEFFLETAAEYNKPENMYDVRYICCPCVDCCNEEKTRDIEEIREHLLVRGFMSGYTYWTEHGEYKEVVEGYDVVDQMNHCWTEQNMAIDDIVVRDDDNADQMNYCWTEQNMAGREDTDEGGHDDVDDPDEILQNVDSEFSGKSQNDKFSQIMKDYKIPLFSGCKKKCNKLHVILALLQMKASNGWSDKGFNELLQFFNDLLPKANVLPQSTYQEKKIICQLGLEVEKIHACRNDCMLFRNKDSMFEECHVRGISRYKQIDKNIDEDDMRENKKLKEWQVKWHGLSP
jgi:hypothetical protein